MTFRIGEIIGELQIYFSDTPITINVNINHILYEISRASNVNHLIDAFDNLSKKDNDYLVPKKQTKNVGGGRSGG